jgi:hypothetical protein
VLPSYQGERGEYSVEGELGAKLPRRRFWCQSPLRSPVLACIVIFVLMCFYGMDKITPQMTADLEKRHAEA